MKPRFALDLSNESVALLERSGSRWTMIAQLALDSPDLPADLGRLRALMESRAPGGYCTKLILPNSQILYLEIEAPGPDRQSRRAQIAAALAGRTPYAVGDLVFDWSQSGALAKVAVIARETLDEADAFAEENGFCPVAFVAVPEAARFGGEPYFGLTAGATDHITHGERLDRDQDPVMITGIALADLPEVTEPRKDLPTDSPPTVADAEPQSAPVDALAATPEPDQPIAGGVLPDGPKADLSEPELPRPAAQVSEPAPSEPAPLPDTPVPAPETSPAQVPADPPIDADPADNAHDLATAPDNPLATPAPTDAPDATLTDAEFAPEPPVEAPFIAIEDESVIDTDAQPASDVQPTAETEPDVAAILQKIRSSVTQGRNGQGSADAGNLSDGVLAAPTGFQSRRQAGPGGTEGARLATVSPRLGAFASRTEAQQAKTDGTAHPSLTNAPAIDVGSGDQAHGAQTAFGRVGAAGRAGLTDVQRRIGSAPWDKPKRSKEVGAESASGRSTRPMIAAAMVAAVAVCLALAVLLWSMFIGTAPAPATVGVDGTTTDTASTPVAQPLDLPVADSNDANDPPSDESAETPPADVPTDAAPDAPMAPDAPVIPDAQVATSDSAPAPAITPPPAPAAPTPAPVAPTSAPVIDPSPAPAVPASAPATLATPEGDTAATITEVPEPAASEAASAKNRLALAVPATDGALGPQPLPLPFDQMPVLGADGLIVPTVAGVLTPGGYTLYAGKPDVVPPTRPARPTPALAPVTPPVITPAITATDAPADAVTSQKDDPLFAVKPRPRPPGFAPPPTLNSAPTPAATPLDTGALSPGQPPVDGVAPTEALPPADPKLASVKPKARPAAVIRAAVANQQNQNFVANAAVDAALAEAQAQAAVLNNPTAQAVSRSDLPVRRPKGLVARVAAQPAAAPVVVAADTTATDTSAVDAALAEANQTAIADSAPAPADAATADAASANQPLDEPEPTAGVPNMPTTKTVAKKSTLANALNLGNINLIGVYGSSNNRRALVRMSSGRFIKVQIGDALDGGQVAAIGDNELAYVKGGRTIVLRMVKGG